jgi:hypothetical protein
VEQRRRSGAWLDGGAMTFADRAVDTFGLLVTKVATFLIVAHGVVPGRVSSPNATHVTF